MQTIQTKAIVLGRTNYGEADRIVHLLTPDHGVVGAIAKGVRREKSKLAGGIELLAVSDVTLHKGRGSLWLVTAARLETFYGEILRDYDRLQFAYYVLKDVSKAAEMVPEPEFYELLRTTLWSLNVPAIQLAMTTLWYRLQMAILLGVGLNLATDASGDALQGEATYRFDVGEMAFVRDERGNVGADCIKLLRVASANSPQVLAKISVPVAVLEAATIVARAVHE